MRRVTLLVICVAAMCAACGSSKPDPATLLRQVKQVVDAAPSAHFQLTSSALQGAGPYITGGTGDMKRPNGFSGSLDVFVSGFTASVEVVDVNNTFYVKLPTSNSFQVTNPAAYGFGNPGLLLDPNHGLSNLLVICARPAYGANDRLNGEELYEVTCSLPGSSVKALLVDAAPAKPVATTIGIATSSNQLRRVVLTGPFFSATVNSTFTLVVDSYGEDVSITPPPVGSS